MGDIVNPPLPRWALEAHSPIVIPSESATIFPRSEKVVLALESRDLLFFLPLLFLPLLSPPPPTPTPPSHPERSKRGAQRALSLCSLGYALMSGAE